MYKAITNFGLYGVLPEEEDKVWAYGFDALAASIASAQKRYSVAVENGKKGGRPPKAVSEAKKMIRELESEIPELEHTLELTDSLEEREIMEKDLQEKKNRLSDLQSGLKIYMASR